MNQSGQTWVVSARRVPKLFQSEGHLSEHDTLAQPNTRLQEEARAAFSPLESQHTAAAFTSLTVPGERQHNREAQASEYLLVAKLLVHRQIIRSNSNSEKLYGEDEKAWLVCGIGQDNACASSAECVKLSLVLLEREPNHKDCN